MFSNPSLITRIALGKLIGLLFGIIGFISLPFFYPATDTLLQCAVLLWYPTVGAFIGVFGVFNYHPILKLPLPWWFRAPLIGAWMNFVLVLFTYELMLDIMLTMFHENTLFTSPFWFVLEGAIIGLIIGYFATKFGGEGIEAVTNEMNE